MKTYYGVYRVVGNESEWVYVGTEQECREWADCVPSTLHGQVHVREIMGEVDEVWSIRAEVARARGEVEPLIYEDDELIGVTPGDDREKELDEQTWVFEKYIEVTKVRQPYQEKWEALRYQRSVWWSLFKEEMEMNWLELTVYERVSNHYLNPRNPNGIYSIPDNKTKWNVFAWIWEGQQEVVEKCERLQLKRMSYTKSIYKRCMEKNAKCKAFWKTAEGIALTNLNQERSDYWEMIKDLNITWEDYNTLVNGEINPYWTNGETEEVDDMTLSLPTYYEYLDILEDSHNQEMSAMDRGPSSSIGYWDFSIRNSPVYAINPNHRTVVGRNGATHKEQYSVEEWSSLMDEFESWD